MKVTDNLLHRKTDAAKGATTEKKKAQDAALPVILEKKTVSKRKNPNVSEKDKEIVSENPQPEAAKPQEKGETVFEGDGDVDATVTPQFLRVMEMLMLLQPSTFYPRRAREIKEPKY
jgi:hypothetical protein